MKPIKKEEDYLQIVIDFNKADLLKYKHVIFPDSNAEPKVNQMSDAETIDYTSGIYILGNS